ncbi:MAG: hypothetical protein ACREJM_09975 [Candidatus Saccharimonadales bacterium]
MNGGDSFIEALYAMPYPHIIRLRGPWQYTPLVRFDDERLPPAGRVELPADWGATLGDYFRGRVRYERSFNPPTNLDPHERVWIVADGADARADVGLNCQSLGTVEGYALSSEWDVTARIGPRNTMSLEVELSDGRNQGQCGELEPPGHRQGSAPATARTYRLRPGREALPGEPIGQVRLEIRSTAFLENLSLWVAVETNGPTLHCSGKVCGEGEASPLSLVVGALEREILYENVAAGQPFAFTAEAGGMPVWAPGGSQRLASVEIKLLSGGEAVWHRLLETAAIDIGSRCGEQPAIGPNFASGDLASQIEQLLSHIVGGSSLVAMPQILPEPLYAVFDRAGVAVLQAMPPDWAAAVCPRLAHHPSISAWLLPPDTPSKPYLPGSPCHGRRWVARG